MWREWREKIEQIVGSYRKGDGPSRSDAQNIRRERRALVQSRPETLESRYEIAQDSVVVGDLFQRLRRAVFRAADQSRSDRRPLHFVQQEQGRINDERPYFYLKPANEKGWLFEESAVGWIISRAEKINGQNLFLREGEVWDIAVIHSMRDGGGTIRVTSGKGGGELLPFSVYEQKLIAAMGIPSAIPLGRV